MNIFKPLFILLSLAFVLPVAAADFSFAPPPKGQMVMGNFVQSLPSGEHTTGRFWLAADGSARWAQASPHEMLLVSSKGKAWQIEPDLNQAVLHQVPENDLLTALQSARLRSEPGKPGVYQGHIEGVGPVSVHMEPGAPMPSLVVQHEEGVTTRFLQVGQRPIDSTLFIYTPPPGMDVVQ